jgi:hypothetical protein
MGTTMITRVTPRSHRGSPSHLSPIPRRRGIRVAGRGTIHGPTLALLLAVVAWALVACAGQGNPVGAPPPTGSTSTDTVATAPVTTAPPTSAPTAAPPPATQPVPAGGTRCHSGQLHIDVAAGASAAGHIGLVLVFTNTGTQSCTMYGYPGVSFATGTAGGQIGDPAQRSSAQGGSTLVPVPAGGQAHADLLLVDTMNFPTATCHPVTAAGIRIYPPDETQALFVASAQRVCSSAAVGLATIYPVRSGARD